MSDPQGPDYANTPPSPQRPPLGYRPLDIHGRPPLTIIAPLFSTYLHLAQEYLPLRAGELADTVPPEHRSCEHVSDPLPRAKRLRKDHPRLLMILPWLGTGGADKFNLDLVEQLTMILPQWRVCDSGICNVSGSGREKQYD